MPEEIKNPQMKNNPNSEINLNLKMPPESAEDGFTMRDLVLTLYNARKVFLTWCCVGLLLGIIAAAGYFVTQRGRAPSVSGDVHATLTLNYSGAEEGLFPTGAEFDANSFYDVELWENTLKSIGREDITPALAMSELVVTLQNVTDDEEDINALENTQTLNVFELVMPSNNTIFTGINEKKEFLETYSEEYKKLINVKFFNDENIDIIYMETWNNLTKDIVWDAFSFEKNFDELNSRYLTLAEYLETLYSADPAYKYSGEKSFYDYASELRKVSDDAVFPWIIKTNENIYIRNIDRFKNESGVQVDKAELERDYSLEKFDLYNKLLVSFQQNVDSEGTIIEETVEVLTTAQSQADNAAELQKQIKQTEYYAQMLETNEPAIRLNSREAEDALTTLIEELDKNQENLTQAVYDYYEQKMSRDAEISVLFTAPAVSSETASGVSMTRVLMLFIGLTFVGVVIGFCAAFVKKYLPEKGKK